MEVFTGWHEWAVAEPELRELLPPEVADAVSGAVEFAVSWHGAQLRPTGAPYVEHLLEALEVLVRGAGIRDPDVLRAAVLHDVLEDTPCSREQIAARFGPEVASLVAWVTIPVTEPGQDKKAIKEGYLRRLRDAPRKAVLVKLADRASNVQTLRNLAPLKQRAYYAQTVTHIVPLASIDPWFARWYATWQDEFQDLGT